MDDHNLFRKLKNRFRRRHGAADTQSESESESNLTVASRDTENSLGPITAHSSSGLSNTAPVSAASSTTAAETSVNVSQLSQDQPISSTTDGTRSSRSEELMDEPLSTFSRRLWDEAFDRLEKEESELMQSYLTTLERVLRREQAAAAAVGQQSENTQADDELLKAEVSEQCRDRANRQIFMARMVKEGQARIAKASKITRGIGSFSDAVLLTKPVVDLIIQGVPQAAPAALPWAGVCIGLQCLSNPAKAKTSNLQGIAYIASGMEWYCELPGDFRKCREVASTHDSYERIQGKIEKGIITLYKAVLAYQVKSVCSYYRNQGLEFLRDLFTLENWGDNLQSVKDAEAALRGQWEKLDKAKSEELWGRLIQLSADQIERLGDITQDLQAFFRTQLEAQTNSENNACLRDLRVVNPADAMATIERDRGGLVEDVYNWILEDKNYRALTSWDDFEAGPDPCRVLWVRGDAGTGKTMMLVGMIKHLSDQSAMLTPSLSYFFCQSTDKTSNNTALATLRSLIWMLLIQQPDLIAYLKPDYASSGASLFTDDAAFSALLRLFEAMLKTAQPVYFLVDALDEYGPDAQELIQIISSSVAITNKVRWIVSSRREVEVIDELKNPTVARVVDLNSQNLKDPVNIYIKHKLSTLKGKKGYTPEVLEAVATEMYQRSENIFLWVSLVFKQLNSTRGWNAVKAVSQMPAGLPKLYDHMMVRIERETGDLEHCKHMLISATLAHRELTLPELAVLAGLPREVDENTILQQCCSFLMLAEEQTVKIIHKSAQDYLLENFERKLHPGGISQAHADLVKRSVDGMSCLKRDIYGLGRYGTKVEQVTPPENDPLAPIRYICIFWVDHLGNVINSAADWDEELGSDILGFFQLHFLHWLESLSLMKVIQQVIMSTRGLLSSLQRLLEPTSPLIRFLRDAQQFVEEHGAVIQKVPLQAYATALVFSPTTSDVRALFWHERSPAIRAVRGGKSHWEARVRTFQGVFPGVSDWRTMVYSPDGGMLAIIERQGKVQLLDSITGLHRQTLADGYGGAYPSTIAFSPDSRRLAVGYSDGALVIWNIAAGDAQTLGSHKKEIIALAFSSDGETLASASKDCGIQYSRYQDATAKSYSVDIGDRAINHGVFSPDVKMFASVAQNSDESLLSLWVAETGDVYKAAKLDEWGQLFVGFSPDGKTVLTSGHRGIILWDAASLTICAKQDYSSTLIASSPDGKSFALRTFEEGVWKVVLLDAAANKPRQTLTCGAIPSDLTFSPDSQTLALCSDDGIELHDVIASDSTGQREVPLGTTFVPFLLSSKDEKIIAVILGAKITLLDRTTWSINRSITATGICTYAAFSPDSGFFASVSSEGIFQIWSTASGALMGTFEGWASMPSLQLGGGLLATSYGGRALVWDVPQESIKHSYPKAQDVATVLTLAFSDDGKTLVTAAPAFRSDETAIYSPYSGRRSINYLDDMYKDVFSFWDVATATLRHKLNLDVRDTSRVALSQDGRLALYTLGEVIQLRDAATGALKQTARSYGEVCQLSFLPDGRLKTERGLVDFEADLAGESRNDVRHRSSIYVQNDWVTWEGDEVLCLPRSCSRKSRERSPRFAVVGHDSLVLTEEPDYWMVVEFGPSE